jgi:sulfatase modifying factor 1
MPPRVAAITIATVPVGNVGNAAEPSTTYGAVSYNYNIGKYEVTEGQYTAFLNAVATASDTYSLYNSYMATDFSNSGITQSGGSVPRRRVRRHGERVADLRGEC